MLRCATPGTGQLLAGAGSVVLAAVPGPLRTSGITAPLFGVQAAGEIESRGVVMSQQLRS